MFKNSQSLRWVTFTSAHGSLESASFLLPICQPPCHLLQPPHHVHECRKLHTTKLIICACYEPLLFLSFFLSFLSAAANWNGAETITNTWGLCLFKSCWWHFLQWWLALGTLFLCLLLVLFFLILFCFRMVSDCLFSYNRVHRKHK